MTSRTQHSSVLVFAAALSFGLVACSSPPAPSPVTPIESAPAPTAVAAGGGLPEFESVCKDGTGDTQQVNGADFTDVSMVSDGSLLFVTFDLANEVSQIDLPDSNFQVLVYDADGEGGYILGVSFFGDGTSNIYAFDSAQAKQRSYDNGYVFDGGKVSIRFPVADLAGLADGLQWYATSSVGADDSDYCGGPPDAMNVVELG
jgi:hypothetical protein